MKKLFTFLILLAVPCLGQNQTVSGGTTGGNIYPANSGQNLGNANQRWNVYTQNLDVVGSFYLNGVPFSGSSIPLGSAGQQLVIDSAGSASLWQSKSVLDVRDYAGSNAGAKIAAAMLAAENNGGGIVDARGLIGAQTISSTLVVGASGKGVHLLLGPTIFTCTITNGTDCVQVANGSRLTGATNGFSLIQLGPAANVSSILTNADHSGGQEFFNIEHLQLYGSNTATVTSGCLDLQALFVPSAVSDVVVANCNAKGLRLRNNGSAGLGPISIHNFWSNGCGNCSPANTNAIPVSIENAGPGAMNANFSGALAFEHAGNGHPELSITGDGSGHSATNIHFTGTLYCENSFAGSDCVDISDGVSIWFDNLIGGGIPGTNLVKIDQTFSTGSSYIRLDMWGHSGFTNTVKDNVNSGRDITVANGDHYIFQNPNFQNADTWLGDMTMWGTAHNLFHFVNDSQSDCGDILGSFLLLNRRALAGTMCDSTRAGLSFGMTVSNTADIRVYDKNGSDRGVGLRFDGATGLPSFPNGATFGNGSAGKAVCWKTTTTLGYCSTQPDAGGACTCN